MNRSWDIEIGANLDYWDAMCWVFALGLCEFQEKGTEHFTEGLTPGERACDMCYDTGLELVREQLREMLNAFGGEAYECGRQNVPSPAAERRALRALIGKCARLVFGSDKAESFLAEVDSHPYCEDGPELHDEGQQLLS